MCWIEILEVCTYVIDCNIIHILQSATSMKKSDELKFRHQDDDSTFRGIASPKKFFSGTIARKTISRTRVRATINIAPTARPSTRRSSRSYTGTRAVILHREQPVEEEDGRD